MKLPKEEVEKIKSILKESRHIMVLCHANPDGDALGSLLGTFLGLRKIGLKVSAACYDQIPETFTFLPESDRVIMDFREDDYDTYVFLDCGHPKLLKFESTKGDILTHRVKKINIDHHPTNPLFGDANLVISESASTSQILYHLFQELEIPLDHQMATCLLTGLYTDTGSFMHQNTTSESYKVAAELLRAGADFRIISSQIFRRYSPRTLKLWGKVLQNLHLSPEGAAIVGVEKEDYESIGASREDLNGVVDLINSMPEAEYCVLLSEDENGNVKASLRTRKEDLDMKALAEQFGGGGHVKASGFTIKGGRLEKEVKWRIVQDKTE